MDTCEVVAGKDVLLDLAAKKLLVSSTFIWDFDHDNS
jgi:hypothetical protein